MKVSNLKVVFGSAALAAAVMLQGAQGWSAEAKKAAAKAKTAAKAEAPAAAAATTYEVDPAKSELRWLAKKVTGQHNGTVKVKSGQIVAAGGNVTGGNVVFDMTSIADSDLTNADSNAKLTGHLKSDDFFGVDKFPTAEFAIVSAKPISNGQGGATHHVAGTLTVKGSSHPLEFDAAINLTGDTATAKANGVKVDRTLYNVRYGSGKFFENLGNKTIEDTFNVDFDLTAKKK